MGPWYPVHPYSGSILGLYQKVYNPYGGTSLLADKSIRPDYYLRRRIEKEMVETIQKGEKVPQTDWDALSDTEKKEGE